MYDWPCRGLLNEAFPAHSDVNHCEIYEPFVTAAHFIVRHCSLCQQCSLDATEEKVLNRPVSALKPGMAVGEWCSLLVYPNKTSFKEINFRTKVRNDKYSCASTVCLNIFPHKNTLIEHGEILKGKWERFFWDGNVGLEMENSGRKYVAVTLLNGKKILSLTS